MGEKVVDIQVPIGNVIPQLSALSYDGAIRFNMCMCVRFLLLVSGVWA